MTVKELIDGLSALPDHLELRIGLADKVPTNTDTGAGALVPIRVNGELNYIHQESGLVLLTNYLRNPV
jgi:hypothetical protein